MSYEKETIEDIVKEMRGNAEHNHALVEVSKYLTEIADRIEASANRQFREVAKMIPHEEVDVSKMETTTPTRENSSQVVNAAAMREALMEASIALSSAIHHHMTEDDAKDCLAVIETAISEPPRNCDVGTEQEQFERFDRWCKSRSMKDCWGVGCRKCLIAWSQIPYEEVKK